MSLKVVKKLLKIAGNNFLTTFNDIVLSFFTLITQRCKQPKPRHLKEIIWLYK
jgi:hypothetical protein